MNYPSPHQRISLQASFFLHNQLIGSGEIRRLQVVTFPQWNIAYGCKVCGDLWGRMAVDSGGWYFHSCFCPKHSPKTLPDCRPYGFGEPPAAPGGSFLQYLPLEVEYLPFSILLYEFNLWSQDHASN